MKFSIANSIQYFFNRGFHVELEPIELFKAIDKEISNKSQKVSDEILAPNDFIFFLEEKNYGRLSSNRIVEALIEIAERKVIKDDLFMDGDLNIKLQKDKTLKDFEFKIQSLFLEEKSGDKTTRNDEEYTIVLERKKFDAPLNLPKFHALATLTVIEGNNKDLKLELTEKSIYIGRKENNDLILNDDKVSRLHAYISYERHRHVMIDAGSLNGSYVDGERVERIYLNNKDIIRIGETLLRYEVM